MKPDIIALARSILLAEASGIVHLSKLAIESHCVLNTFVSEEACQNCYFNMAPTQSTTVTLALGDVLALIVAQLKEFKQDDFTHHHPGGHLGDSH